MARVPFSRSRSPGDEDLRDQPHIHVAHEGRIRARGRDDARALLAAMLQGEEAVIGQHGGVWVAVNGKNAALVGGFVVLHAQEERDSSRWQMRVKRTHETGRALSMRPLALRQAAQGFHPVFSKNPSDLLTRKS